MISNNYRIPQCQCFTITVHSKSHSKKSPTKIQKDTFSPSCEHVNFFPSRSSLPVYLTLEKNPRDWIVTNTIAVNCDCSTAENNVIFYTCFDQWFQNAFRKSREWLLKGTCDVYTVWAAVLEACLIIIIASNQVRGSIIVMKFKLKNKCSHEFQYTKRTTPPTICIHNILGFSFEVLPAAQTVKQGCSGGSLHLLTLTSGWELWQETLQGSAGLTSS